MKISVIIPTLNEAQLISQAIRAAWVAGIDEVVVVDGGSDDDTFAKAAKEDCLLVTSDSGRGIQLNAGARVASGSVLLFLHADTRLENSASEQINQCVGRGHCCGAFRQRIDASGLIFRLIELGNGCRVRWLQMAYGDQGIFVTRQVFEELGGFDEIPVMEDFSFSLKLKQKYRYELLPGPLHVNPRHWQARGTIRQTITNWVTIWRFMNGVGPAELNYHPVRQTQKKSDTE